MRPWSSAVTLYLYPLRGEGLPHKRLFTLSQHRRIGWIALVLGLLHAAILLVAQPLVGHYLLPSAPLYMLLGLIALIALAILVATGLAARSALRSASTRRTKTSEPRQLQDPGRALAHSVSGTRDPTQRLNPRHPRSPSTGSHRRPHPGKPSTREQARQNHHRLRPAVAPAFMGRPPHSYGAASPAKAPPPPTNPTPQLRRSRAPIPTPHPHGHLAPATAGGDPVTPPGVLPPREAHHRRLRNLPSQLRRQNRRRQLPRMPSLFPTQPHPVSGSHVPHLLPNLPHRSGSNDRQTRPHPRLLHLPRQLFNSSLTARSACSMATSV